MFKSRTRKNTVLHKLARVLFKFLVNSTARTIVIRSLTLRLETIKIRRFLHFFQRQERKQFKSFPLPLNSNPSFSFEIFEVSLFKFSAISKTSMRFSEALHFFSENIVSNADHRNVVVEEEQFLRVLWQQAVPFLFVDVPCFGEGLLRKD